MPFPQYYPGVPLSSTTHLGHTHSPSPPPPSRGSPVTASLDLQACRQGFAPRQGWSPLPPHEGDINPTPCRPPGQHIRGGGGRHMSGGHHEVWPRGGAWAELRVPPPHFLQAPQPRPSLYFLLHTLRTIQHISSHHIRG